MLTTDRPTPRLSVIVPFHGKPSAIEPCLDALMQSQHPSFEVIVVDDASSVPLKGDSVIRMPVCSGPAASRNTGASKARGDVLVFIDADIIVAPESLAMFEEKLRNTDVTAVQACYRYPGIGTNLPTRFLDDFQEYKVRGLGHQEIRSLRGGCFAVKADAFRSVNGFDENYKTPNQEDSDLGWRLSATGLKIACATDIRVLHLKQIADHFSLCRRYFSLFKGMIKLKMRASAAHSGVRPENTMGRSVQTWRPAVSVVCLSAVALAFAFLPIYSAASIFFLFLGATIFILTNLPFLRFVQNERGARNTLTEILPLALMYFTLLLAIPSAVIEFPFRRY